MTRRRHDVIVVGGGPAGATAAALMAARGVPVLLVDRADFPRPKPCGESLNPGAVRELARLGAEVELRAFTHGRISRWKVEAPGGHCFEGGYPAGIHGLAIDRTRLDALLLERAARFGAEVETGVRVDDLLRGPTGVRGVRTARGRVLEADLVIGADGLRSVVARRLGLHRRGSLRKLALTAHVRGACLPPETGILTVRHWGCVGAVGMGADVANIVVVLSEAAAPAVRGDAAGFFDRSIAGVPALAGAIRVTPVLATGPFDAPLRRVAAPGAILIGDAAGYFDPFTGQGVFKALRSAREAATMVERCGSAPDPAALQRYDHWYRRSFAPSRRLQRLIEFGASRPAVFESAVAVLAALPGLADRLVAVTGDVVRFSHLFLPGRQLGSIALRHHPAGIG